MWYPVRTYMVSHNTVCPPPTHYFLESAMYAVGELNLAKILSREFFVVYGIDASGLVCRLPAFDTHRGKLANLPTYLSKIRLQLIVHDRQLYSPLLVSYRK